jgi:hypothetical protein
LIAFVGTAVVAGLVWRYVRAQRIEVIPPDILARQPDAERPLDIFYVPDNMERLPSDVIALNQLSDLAGTAELDAPKSGALAAVATPPTAQLDDAEGTIRRATVARMDAGMFKVDLAGFQWQPMPQPELSFEHAPRQHHAAPPALNVSLEPVLSQWRQEPPPADAAAFTSEKR